LRETIFCNDTIFFPFLNSCIESKNWRLHILSMLNSILHIVQEHRILQRNTAAFRDFLNEARCLEERKQFVNERRFFISRARYTFVRSTTFFWGMLYVRSMLKFVWETCQEGWVF
jgi:hypothetical protein